MSAQVGMSMLPAYGYTKRSAPETEYTSREERDAHFDDMKPAAKQARGWRARAPSALPNHSGAGGSFWTPTQDDLLLAAIEKHGPKWKAVAEDVSPNCTSAMARNRFQRMRAPLEGKPGRNRCKKCGQVKRGHTCTADNGASGEGRRLVAPGTDEESGAEASPVAQASPFVPERKGIDALASAALLLVGGSHSGEQAADKEAASDLEDNDAARRMLLQPPTANYPTPVAVRPNPAALEMAA